MRRFVPLAIKLALTAIILAAIVWKLDLASAARTIASVAPASVVAALGLAFLQSVCAAIRLSAVISKFGRHIGFRKALRVTLEASFFAQTFLSFVGGDVFRIFRIRKSGMKLEDATAAITLDRLIGTIVNHGVLLMTLPWLLPALTAPSLKIGLLILAGAGVAGTGLVLLLGYLRTQTKIARHLPQHWKSNRLIRLLLECSTVGRMMLPVQPALVIAVFMSALIAIINSLIFFVLLLGWHVGPGVAAGCALLVPAIMEIALLPISIAGWGVREGLVILTFGTLGVPSEIAFGSSFVFAIVTMAIGLAGGLMWLFDSRGVEISEGAREQLSRALD